MSEIILTKEQQAVVEDRGGALLVSAAAGSGKTRVLIDRVLARVEQEHCDLNDFLLITFTQPAASELRGKLIARLSEALAERPDDRHLQRQMHRVYLAQISTVHAFCASLLRDYAYELGLPADFRICDDQEALTLKERALTQTLEEAYQSDDPQIAEALNLLGAGRDDKRIESLILQIYENLQCSRDPKKRLRELRESTCVDALTDAGETIWGKYLLKEFRAFSAACLGAMQRALEELRLSQTLQKTEAVFEKNCALLQRYATVQTWQQLREIPCAFGTLTAVKDTPEAELQERCTALRDRIRTRMKKKTAEFSATSEEALRGIGLTADALNGLLSLTERFSEVFYRAKRQRHALDYNDLEHETLHLLLQSNGMPTRYAAQISGRFREIMVDEYQDTNEAQDAIFHAISADGTNLFFVGDVKQSIYRFRQADPTIFLGKYKTFCDYDKAEQGQPRRILLSDNFRSHREVLAAANDVFSMTMSERVGGLHYGAKEALRAKREMPEMPQPAVELHCLSMDGFQPEGNIKRAEIEAEYVARRIAKMLRDGELIPDGSQLRPVRPEDIVILLRALSGKAECYIQALRRHGIACECGSENIFRTDEIIALTALLRVVDNPHQDIPLLTVLFSPLFCFAADELALARGAKRDGNLYEALPKTRHGQDFLSVLGQLRDCANDLCALLAAAERLLHLRAVYGAMSDGARRVRNLDRFFALADSFENGERYGLAAFLRYLDLLSAKGISTDLGKGAGAVRLTTIHKSKGLEFPVVILADLMKPFNTTDANEQVLCDPVLGIGCNVYDPERCIAYPTIARRAISKAIRASGRSEEMRVLYVAMTRAQYRLVMVCCDKLEKRLTEFARELTVPAEPYLTEGVSCAGDWILMTALARSEAGELFAVCGYPEARSVRDLPWRITYRAAQDVLPLQQEAEKETEAPRSLPFLPYDYPHTEATYAPAKLTATQLKGRMLDEEVSAQTVPEFRFQAKKPQFFRGKKTLNAAQRGTAIHLAMQYLRYENCSTLQEITRELERLRSEAYLTAEQVEAVAPDKLLRFFTSALGKRVLSAPQRVREFKFSVLEDGSTYASALQGEKILLQGVTDCCLIEPDGLVILDFKTDRVQAGEEAQRGAYYRGQLDAYSRALSRVFAQPVKERILYFFSTDTAVVL